MCQFSRFSKSVIKFLKLTISYSDFEWFMRADDDAYIKPEELEKFLRSIDSNKPYFIGKAGVGRKDDKDEHFMDKNGFYCCGGTGMIFSKPVLKLIGPNIDFCVDNLLSEHEDIEVSRCIQRFTGLLCTRSWEIDDKFLETYGSFKELNSSSKAFQKALTIHPLKTFGWKYEVHISYLRSKIREFLKKEAHLENAIENLNSVINHAISKSSNNSTTVLSYPKDISMKQWDLIPNVKVKDLFDIHYHSKNSKHIVMIKDKDNHFMRNLKQYFSPSDNRHCTKNNYLLPYKRINTLSSIEYLMDFVNPKCFGKQENTLGRYYIKHRFKDLEFLEFSKETKLTDLGKEKQNTSNNENDRQIIHFVLSVGGRLEYLINFMKNYEKVCLSSNQGTSLHVSVMDENVLTSSAIIRILEWYQTKYGQNAIEILYTNKTFSRAEALNVGTSTISTDSLIFIIDLEMVFDKNLLHRVRMNTEQGTQVYSPIIFRRYNPLFLCLDNVDCKIKGSNFSNAVGLWQHFGYGLIGLYKSDFVAAGGFDHSIKGLGNEDIDFVDKIVKIGLVVHRSADISLVHCYDPKIYTDELKILNKYISCQNSKSEQFACQLHLSKLEFCLPELFHWT